MGQQVDSSSAFIQINGEANNSNIYNMSTAELDQVKDINSALIYTQNDLDKKRKNLDNQTTKTVCLEAVFYTGLACLAFCSIAFLVLQSFKIEINTYIYLTLGLEVRSHLSSTCFYF